MADDSNQAKQSTDSDCGLDELEIDLNDIVIIDEYDSTKTATKQEELEKKVCTSIS